jgi:hypothetical protein
LFDRHPAISPATSPETAIFKGVVGQFARANEAVILTVPVELHSKLPVVRHGAVTSPQPETCRDQPIAGLGDAHGAVKGVHGRLSIRACVIVCYCVLLCILEEAGLPTRRATVELLGGFAIFVPISVISHLARSQCHIEIGAAFRLRRGVDPRSTSHVVGKLRQASWGQHTRSTGRPGTSLPISRTLTKPASPFTASCDVRDFLDKPSMPWGALQPEFGESRATQSSRRDGWCRDFRQGY